MTKYNIGLRTDCSTQQSLYTQQSPQAFQHLTSSLVAGAMLVMNTVQAAALCWAAFADPAAAGASPLLEVAAAEPAAAVELLLLLLLLSTASALIMAVQCRRRPLISALSCSASAACAACNGQP
jgi:hypothetical protein